MGENITIYREVDPVRNSHMLEEWGRELIKGKDNILSFEIETDQTCFKPVIMGLDSLKRKLKDEVDI